MSKMFKLKPSQVDIERIVFQEPKTDQRGNINVPIKYLHPETDKPVLFTIVLPELYAFVGVSCYDNDNNDRKNYSLPLSIDKIESEEEHKAVEKLFNAIDKKVIDTVHNNPKWIKQSKKTPKAVIEAFHSPSIKYPIDKMTGEKSDKYPPNLRFKLSTTKEGEFLLPVYSSKKELLGPANESIGKGSRVKSLIEVRDLWTVGGKFGTRIRMLQAKVKAAPSKYAYAFSDSEDDEEDEQEEKVNNKNLDKKPPAPADSSDSDSDSSDEE